MQPLSRSIIRLWLKLDGGMEQNGKKKIYAAPYNGRVVITNGTALFEFEEAPADLWEPLLPEMNGRAKELERLLSEHWTSVLGIDIKKAVAAEEAGPGEDGDCMVYETKRGNRALMSMDHYDLMFKIVDPPTVKIQFYPGASDPGPHLHYLLVFEENILRGVIANRRP